MGAAAFDERQMHYRGMAAVSLEEYAACLDAALGAAGAEARVVRAVLPWSPERVSRSVPDASQPVFAEVARASASDGEGASTAGVAAASEWAREVSRVSASRRGAHVEASMALPLKCQHMAPRSLPVAGVTRRRAEPAAAARPRRAGAHGAWTLGHEAAARRGRGPGLGSPLGQRSRRGARAMGL